MFSCYVSGTICAHTRTAIFFTNLFSLRPLAMGLELAKLAGVALLVLAAFAGLACFWLRRQEEPSREPKPLRRRWFFVIFGGLLLIWLGYYALEYPGLTALPNDPAWQLNQYSTGDYSNWHPVVHSFLLGSLSLTLGHGSLVPYVLFQMTALAACLTYALYWIHLRAGARFCLPLGLVWFALHPVFAYMSFTIRKDTLFCAALLLLTIELAEFALTESSFGKNPAHLVLLTIGALGTVFFRNNGVLILLLLLPCLFLLLRGRRKKLWLGGSIAFALGCFLLVQTVLFPALHVKQTPVVESLAVPLQQIGRVMHEVRPLRREEAAFLNEVLPLGRWKEYYDPTRADEIKFAKEFNDTVIEEHPGTFVKIWAGLFLRYPADFLSAALDLTRPLWDPLTPANLLMRLSDRASEKYPFLNPRSAAPHLQMSVRRLIEVCRCNRAFLLFWSPALLVTVSAGIGLLSLLRRQKERLLPFIPCWGLWLSLLLTIPVIGSRYYWGFYLLMPIYVTFLTYGKPKKTEGV